MATRKIYKYNVTDIIRNCQVLANVSRAQIVKYFKVPNLNIEWYREGNLYKNRFKIEIVQEPKEKKIPKDKLELMKEWKAMQEMFGKK